MSGGPECNCEAGDSDPKKNVPEVLDKMADVILSYRPKEKRKKKRKRKKAKKPEDVENKI